MDYVIYDLLNRSGFQPWDLRGFFISTKLYSLAWNMLIVFLADIKCATKGENSFRLFYSPLHLLWVPPFENHTFQNLLFWNTWRHTASTNEDRLNAGITLLEFNQWAFLGKDRNSYAVKYISDFFWHYSFIGIISVFAWSLLYFATNGTAKSFENVIVTELLKIITVIFFKLSVAALKCKWWSYLKRVVKLSW